MEQSDAKVLSIISPNVIDAAEKADPEKKRDHKGPYTTSQGIILKYRKVPSQILFKAWASLTPPEVPMVWIEEHGRDEPHPMAPSYLEALSHYRQQRMHLTSYIYFMRGIDIFTPLPEGVVPPESDEWFEGLEDILEIDKLKGALARKTAWLMYYALDDEEQSEILNDLMFLSGFLMERDVLDAEDSFRDNEGAEPYTDAGRQEGNTDRHTLPNSSS